ncbi:TlpA family protein disulfide reductase [Luteimonas sp. RIT-PG2_3]
MTSHGWRPALLAILLFAIAGMAHAEPEIGDAPPDLLGTSSQGEEVRVSALRGNVVIVSFWASWCGYCRKLLPVLENFQQQVGRHSLDVVVVNFQEPLRTYRALRRGFKDLSVTLTHDADGAISDAYGVTAVPVVYIIDRAGELAYVHRGYSEASLPRLIEVVNEMLAEPRPPAATGAVSLPGAIEG